jgi:hypothetical protein
MSIRTLCTLLFALVALAPAAVLAQEATTVDDVDESALIRVRGTSQVAPGESIGVVVAIDGNAEIAGTVTELLLVVDGDAVVSGRVDGDVTVVNGTLRLEAGATVDNIFLIRSELERDPAATVTGEITERDSINFDWRGAAIFSILFWLGATLLMLVVALLFAAVAGRQLATAGGLLSGRPGQSIVAMLFTWIVLPIVAILILFTLIGIPVGLAILVVLLPALFFLGYIVTATRVGAKITAGFGRPIDGHHPYLAALLGVLLFQLVGLIPFIGGAIVIISALYGSGGLVYLAWRAFRSRGLTEVATPTPA